MGRWIQSGGIQMNPDSLSQLTQRLRSFASERDWDKFHSPKNLAMALTGEAGELAAELQWLTEDESKVLDGEALGRVKAEAGDVLIYLTRLADKLQIDLIEAANAKISINEQRYPAERVRGQSKKYDQY